MTKTNLSLYNVIFKPKTRQVSEVCFRVCEFSEQAATYLGWTLLKQSGFSLRDFKNKPIVTQEVAPPDALNTLSPL